MYSCTTFITRLLLHEHWSACIAAIVLLQSLTATKPLYMRRQYPSEGSCSCLRTCQWHLQSHCRKHFNWLKHHVDSLGVRAQARSLRSRRATRTGASRVRRATTRARCARGTTKTPAAASASSIAASMVRSATACHHKPQSVCPSRAHHGVSC